MHDKKRIISMFMILVMMFCVFFSEPLSGAADEMPTQGTMFSGPGANYNVIETVDGQADIKVYGEINDWYIVYNPETGNVGCMIKNEITTSSNSSGETGADAILTYTNKEREKAGLTPLVIDKELNMVATEKAKDMVKNNYFSHYSESLGSPFEMLKKSGVIFTKAAENLAGNTTADGAFYSWMNSEKQRDNILNSDYTRTGIGIYNSPVYGQVFVQIFAN